MTVFQHWLNQCFVVTWAKYLDFVNQNAKSNSVASLIMYLRTNGCVVTPKIVTVKWTYCVTVFIKQVCALRCCMSLLIIMETHWLKPSILLCHSQHAALVSWRKLNWHDDSDELCITLIGHLHHRSRQHRSSDLSLQLIKDLTAAKARPLSDYVCFIKQTLRSLVFLCAIARAPHSPIFHKNYPP